MPTDWRNLPLYARFTCTCRCIAWNWNSETRITLAALVQHHAVPLRYAESRGRSRGQSASCARRWTSGPLNRLIGQSTLSDQLTVPRPQTPCLVLGLHSTVTDWPVASARDDYNWWNGPTVHTMRRFWFPHKKRQSCELQGTHLKIKDWTFSAVA